MPRRKPRELTFQKHIEDVGPQLIKQGSVSELMRQIRQTERRAR